MMKKPPKKPLLPEQVVKNPVAKYAHQFNKAQVFSDKSKYRRNAKHKGEEPFRRSFDKDSVKGLFSEFQLSHSSWAIRF
jgi:hypothetical protein